MEEGPATPRSVKASTGQRLLAVLDHYRGHHGALNIPLAYRLRGPLDTMALSSALDGLASRHEALRTTFYTERRRLLQRIHPPTKVPIRSLSLHSAGVRDIAETIDAVTTDRIDPASMPWRVTLAQIADDDHLLFLVVHHLVTDGWSSGIIARDLGRLYARACGAPFKSLPPVRAQFADFVAWQEPRLVGPLADAHQAAWRAQLNGTQLLEVERPPAELRVGPAGATARLDLEPAVVASIREIAIAERTTPFVVLLALFVTAVRREMVQRRFVVATLLANRRRPEFHETVGFFANMALLPCHVRDGQSFRDVVQACRSTVLHALAHQEMPYHLLPRDALPSGSGRADDVVFNMLATPGDGLVLPGIAVEPLAAPDDAPSRFDLEFVLSDESTGLLGMVRHDPSRVSVDFVRRLIATYCDSARELVVSTRASSAGSG